MGGGWGRSLLLFLTEAVVGGSKIYSKFGELVHYS